MYSWRECRIALPLAVWLGAGLCGGPATAGGADCAWRTVSAATRASIISEYRRGGLAPARTFNPPAREVEAVGDRCARNGGDLDAVTEALFLEAMRQDLADRLRGLGVDPTAAEADWSQGLTPAQRERFHEHLTAESVHRPPTPDERAVVARMAGPPYLPPTLRAEGGTFAAGQALLDFDFALSRIADVETRF